MVGVWRWISAEESVAEAPVGWKSEVFPNFPSSPGYLPWSSDANSAGRDAGRAPHATPSSGMRVLKRP